MIASTLRPGYLQIEAATLLAPDSAAWEPFMLDVIGLPLSMLPSVQRVMRSGIWRRVKAPIECVKGNAVRKTARDLQKAAKG